MTTFGGKTVEAQKEKVKKGSAIFPTEYVAKELIKIIKDENRENEVVLYPSEHGFGKWKKTMKIIKSEEHKKINSNTCGELAELCNQADVPISITEAVNLKTTTNHAHKKSTEIYWVTSGSIEMTIENNSVKLNKGDIIVMYPGEFHQVTKVSDDNTVVVLSTPPWSPDDEVLN